MPTFEIIGRMPYRRTVSIRVNPNPNPIHPTDPTNPNEPYFSRVSRASRVNRVRVRISARFRVRF